MKATDATFSDILNTTRTLRIPFFQRAYVWDEPQWRRFLDDMEFLSSSDEPYFFGSIIMKKLPLLKEICLIIDGQQRLTTLAIFFKVLSLKDPKAKYLADGFRLRKDNSIALEHNRIDRDSFERILNLESEKEISVPADKQDNILNLYNFFVENINMKNMNYDEFETKIKFVVVNLEESDNEQKIFNTINSLGVPLTTAELLKNYLFDEDKIDLYTSNWQNVFEFDNDCRRYWDSTVTTGRLERPISDLFFNAFLQIKIQDSTLGLKTDEKRKLIRVDGLFNSYMEYVKRFGIDKNLLTEDIKKYAITFRKYFHTDSLDMDLSCSSDLIDRINVIIFRLENSTVIPYILYVLHNVSNIKERDGIFEYLETYIMRRIICRSSNKNYNQLFGERLIANQVLTRDKLVDALNIDSDKVNAMPTDIDLKKGFYESQLINKQAAGILYLIESRIRNTDQHSTSLCGINHYSLEHLMPKKWKNNWDKLIDQTAIDERNRILLTLGNLAIISSQLNKSIRDSSWKVKLEGKGKSKGLKYYANGLETFSNIMELPQWNEQTIKDRADFLYEQAINIWPIQ